MTPRYALALVADAFERENDELHREVGRLEREVAALRLDNDALAEAITALLEADGHGERWAAEQDARDLLNDVAPAVAV